MGMAYGIIVFGASGSGTTTIGRELARLLNFEHFNTDDYFFMPTDPPFTQERPMQERIELLNAAIKNSFVLSGCIREWGNAFDPMLSLAVFVITPTDVRLKRLEKREFEKYGERIKSGGDLYAYHKKFIEYSTTYDNGSMETRSLASQEYWANNLTCPVVRIDGTIDWRENAKAIAERFYTKSDELWRVKTYPYLMK
jgi:adenylate kinase family enzyme